MERKNLSADYFYSLVRELFRQARDEYGGRVASLKRSLLYNTHLGLFMGTFGDCLQQ